MILVFGGDGQLGRELSRGATERDLPLAALSRAQADIADAAQVAHALRRHAPTIVVNAAAYTHVDRAEDDHAAAFRANAEGPGVLAAACREADVPLVHVSTDYVFDGSKRDPYVETDPIAPVSAYGRSKAAGEAAVREAMPQHLILRTSWVYGEFGHNFLKTILRLARERDELRIVADQHGCPTSTRDLADAILSIAPRLRDADAPYGTYHFTGGGSTSWHGLAQRIVAVQSRYTNRHPAVIPIRTQDYPTRARRPLNSRLDCSRFATVFGFSPQPWPQECERVTEALVRH